VGPVASCGAQSLLSEPLTRSTLFPSICNRTPGSGYSGRHNTRYACSARGRREFKPIPLPLIECRSPLLQCQRIR
jgi:hypothetical protein